MSTTTITKTSESRSPESPKLKVSLAAAQRTQISARTDSAMPTEDSGYTSHSTTPDQQLLNSSPTSSNRGLAARFKRPFTIHKDKCFPSKEVGQAYSDRFREIKSHFEKLLLDFVRKPGARHKPMSTRLIMVGKSLDDCSPHIVVLCQPDQKGLVRSFAKLKLVIELMCPNDPCIPHFNIGVFPNAPRLAMDLSEIEILAGEKTVSERGTICGTPITFRDKQGNFRNATLGGMIKVVTADSKTEVWGLTAGHALEELDDDNAPEDPLPPLSREFTEDITENFNSEGSSQEDDNSSDVDSAYSETESTSISDRDDRSRLWEVGRSSVIGELMRDFADVMRKRRFSTQPCYDWAVFKVKDYNMNLNIIPQDKNANMWVTRKQVGRTGRRPIYILSGSMGSRRGFLLAEPGRILLGHGEEFVDSFMITVDDEKGTADGDSGSWVVDAEDFGVYGQIVATDLLGGAYAIPLRNIFKDIKSQLGLKAVELPTERDIFLAMTECWAGAENLDARSEKKKLLTRHDSLNAIIEILKWPLTPDEAEAILEKVKVSAVLLPPRSIESDAVTVKSSKASHWSDSGYGTARASHATTSSVYGSSLEITMNDSKRYTT